jgi:hypothetical protein
MNKLEEALKQIENRIYELQTKAESIRKQLKPASIVEELAIEQPAPRRGRRRTVNAE